MSISALTSNLVNNLSQQQNPFRQIRQDFRQLASALQNGDLNDAQSDYSNIQQILQANSGPASSGAPSTLQNDFASLGQALQSGDLGQAQNAFSQLESDAAGTPAPAQAPTNDQFVPTVAPSVASPSSTSPSTTTQGQSPIEQALQDYTQLASSLQNGDLTDAQSAYANLQQLVQNYQGPTNSDGAIQNDFATLGQDLQAGNVNGAQTDFSRLQNDIQSALQTQTLSPAQQIQQDYSQLSSALQSGDLTQAQSAFSQLQNDLQSAQQSPTSQTQNSPQSPQTEGRRAEGHHHHHGGGGAAYSYTSSNINLTVNIYA